MEGDPSNLGEYNNCYKELDGYFLDIETFMFKKCYNTCKKCEIKGDDTNHNCLKCKSDFSISINFSIYLNCYEKCEYYHYYDDKNESHCTLACPDDYPVIIPDNLECIKNDNYNMKLPKFSIEHFFLHLLQIFHIQLLLYILHQKQKQ